MGAEQSQESIAAHLERQQHLVATLQSLVDKQNAALQRLGSIAVNYDVNGDGEPAEMDDNVRRVVDGTYRRFRAGEQTRAIEPPVDEMELTAAPDNGWVGKDGPAASVAHFKPWLSSIVAPSKAAAVDRTAPNLRIDLRRVVGFDGQSRGNARWLDKTTVVYSVARVLVVHDLRTDTQQFFQGHNSDVNCVAVHPETRMVASADFGVVPSIHVWAADGCALKATIASQHRRGFSSIAFSPNGELLAAVDASDNHTLAVYRWDGAQLVASVDVGPSPIFGMAWNTTVGATANSRLVTVGVNHIGFWDITAEERLESSAALIGDLGKLQPYTAVTCVGAFVAVGTQGGEVYIFADGKLTRIVEGHRHAIFALASAGGTLFSGSDDGVVSSWSGVSFKRLASLDLTATSSGAALHAVEAGVRSLDAFPNGDLLVGVTGNTLLRVAYAPKPRAVPIVSSHHNGRGQLKLTALAVNARRACFCTVGEDATLREWDWTTRRQVRRIALPAPAQSAAYSHNGATVAVGLQNGTICIFGGKEDVQVSKGRRRVQCLSFSPSDSLLAVGTADNYVDVYTTTTYEHVARLEGPRGVVLKIDWSADGAYLRLCSQSFELIVFDVAARSQVSPSVTRDTVWASQTSLLGWNVQGIWPLGSEFNDVDAVACDPAMHYLASVETSGLGKVFRYPCIGGGLNAEGNLIHRPGSVRFTGHSDDVVDVAWASENILFTAGGRDNAVFEWAISETAPLAPPAVEEL